MMKKKYLTAREYEIMKILWGSEQPMLISDIIKLTDITAKNSVHPILSNLIELGYVKVVGNIKVAKTSSRFYSPAISIEAYTATQINDIFKTKKKYFNWKRFLLCLSKPDKTDNNKTIQTLIKYIEELQENNKDD